MCSSDDVERQIDRLDRLQELLEQLIGLEDDDQTVALSSTQPWKIDYRGGYKYLYVLSPVQVTLTIEDIATLVIPANQWCNLSFQAGMRVTSNTSALTTLFIRATNNPVLLISPLAVSQTIGGLPISATNAEINISNIQQMMLNGTAFSCATGNMASAASDAMQFFTANAQKNVLIWSVRAMYDGTSIDHKFQYITASDVNIAAGTSVIVNALNNMGGPNGAAPASGVGMWINGGVAAPTGTQIDFNASPASQAIEMLSAGDFRIIPRGQAGGIAVYSGTAASNKVGYTVKWVEY